MTGRAACDSRKEKYAFSCQITSDHLLLLPITLYALVFTILGNKIVKCDRCDRYDSSLSCIKISKKGSNICGS